MFPFDRSRIRERKIEMSDDFVMTIDDDDNVVVNEEIIEEEVIEEKVEEKKSKNKKDNKKRKAPEEDQEEFNNEFTFAMDGGGAKGLRGGWDFTTAKGMLKPKQVQ